MRLSLVMESMRPLCWRIWSTCWCWCWCCLLLEGWSDVEEARDRKEVREDLEEEKKVLEDLEEEKKVLEEEEEKKKEREAARAMPTTAAIVDLCAGRLHLFIYHLSAKYINTAEQSSSQITHLNSSIKKFSHLLDQIINSFGYSIQPFLRRDWRS